MKASFFATCPKGVEPLLAGELRDLGATSVEARRAGVSFGGSLETAYRACLWSRTANRVLYGIAEFPAPDEQALYDGVRAMPWSDHLGPEQTLAVDFSSTRSRLTHTQYGALKTKDAIVDRFRDERGVRPSIDVERPDVRVNVHVEADQATVAIDLASESLHRRGYRAGEGEAPLKENLAAAILLLADWPRLARAGVPLLDPLCGTGTLPIEAGLVAADVAPGLGRSYFGFLGWRGHDRATWDRLLTEARDRDRRGRGAPLPPILGCDADARAIRAATLNVERAGLAVRIERRSLADCRPALVANGSATEPRGLLVANPPYGERMGEAAALGPLYASIGDLLRREFLGWRAYVLTGNSDLAKAIGLRAAHRHVLWNGAIECRLLDFPISTEPLRDREGPGWRRPRAPAPEAAAFRNRLEKNLRRLVPWAEREGIQCYRLYDADLPEYAVAVDRYEDAAVVQEYAPPATIDPEKARARLADAVAIVPDVLGVPAADVFVKVRRRQRGPSQYGKTSEEGRSGTPPALREVGEGGLRFFVNLADYIDTGLFLSERRVRALVGRLAAGRDFLNLFSYTGTATVYAARGGALSTTSVDLSNTYLDWARKNLEKNGIHPEERQRHRLVRADVRAFLEDPKGDAGESLLWGLIFVGPPSFSNSKAVPDTIDVQRDHVALLAAAARRLAPGGDLVFSTQLRRFRLDTAALESLGLAVEDVGKETLPFDFSRSARAHHAFRIRR